VKKNDVLELLREMPEEVNVDDLIYRLYLKQKLEAAEAAAKAGDLIPHDEVVRWSGEWLK
jgi:predicted transcriptional regulator